MRGGTTNLFAALDVASGEVIAALTERHRAEEFQKLPEPHRPLVPEDLDVHLVVDNFSTHKTPRSTAGCCATHGSISTSPPLLLVVEPRMG